MRPARTLLATIALLAATVTAAPQGAPMFGGFLAQSNEPIRIDASSLERTLRDGREVLEYSGNVVARRGDMVIRASVLTVLLPAPGGPGGAFERITATGNVSVISGAQNATANNAVMDMVRRTIIMTGDVSLADGTNQMSGQTLTIDLATGGWLLETGANQRVVTVINPPAR